MRAKKLTPKAGNTLGYLATLLLQNQKQVARERERVNEAQYTAEMQAAVDEFLWERAERRKQARAERD